MSNNEFRDPSDNPYQSAIPTPALVGNTKPTSITVFGILNVVYGVMGLCSTIVFFIQMALMGSQPQVDNPILELTNTPVYHGFTLVQMGLNFLATIVLLTSGVGLLGGKPYGRTLSIIFAVFSLISVVVNIVFTAIFLLMPLMERASEMGEGPEKMGLVFGGIALTAGGLCGTIYPIVLLVFMMRAPVVNYMRAQRT